MSIQETIGKLVGDNKVGNELMFVENFTHS